jgi:amino acid transporter
VLHAYLWWLYVRFSALLLHPHPPSTDIHFAERFIDPAMGFALGWLQWYGGVVSLPTEIISATLIIGFWDTGPDGLGMPNSHLAGYLTVSQLPCRFFRSLITPVSQLLMFLCAGVNFLGVRWFGESEFGFVCRSRRKGLVILISFSGLHQNRLGPSLHHRRARSASFCEFLPSPNMFP